MINLSRRDSTSMYPKRTLFFRNRATQPWQRGTDSETNETKARSCRAIITDLFSRITGFAYSWLEIVNKLFNMSPNKLDDRCRNNATSVSWLVCLLCKVTLQRDYVRYRGRLFLRRICHSVVQVMALARTVPIIVTKWPIDSITGECQLSSADVNIWPVCVVLLTHVLSLGPMNFQI